jgi:glutamate formiminotransferase
VFTIAGRPGTLAGTVLSGAATAVSRLNLREHDGIHPRVGIVDVAPIVYLDELDRGAACAEALVLGDLIAAELAIPVFLYGSLGRGRTRADLRRGGPQALAQRMAANELTPDLPAGGLLHARAGATLVGARPPLIAFNLELAPPAREADAQRIATLIRDGGAEGLAGVRALGLWLAGEGRAQVSTNVEDHRAVPLLAVVEAVRRHAPVAAVELVGLAPEAAFAGFPEDIPVRNKRLLEEALREHHLARAATS